MRISDWSSDVCSSDLDDTMAACQALWAPGSASFDSPTVSFQDIWCEPKPVQPGGPPILFSGTLTGRNLRRIERLGSGWLPIMNATMADIEAGKIGRAHV